ncbi:unnamed protein product [Ixodes persulcatus]
MEMVRVRVSHFICSQSRIFFIMELIRRLARVLYSEQDSRLLFDHGVAFERGSARVYTRSRRRSYRHDWRETKAASTLRVYPLSFQSVLASHQPHRARSRFLLSYSFSTHNDWARFVFAASLCRTEERTTTRSTISPACLL